jgi:hypothetical protein
LALEAESPSPVGRVASASETGGGVAFKH